MDMYYVASRIRYAIVPAIDEATAWIAGHEVLHKLHMELLEHSGRDVPVEIEVIRLAAVEEVANWEWHDKTAESGSTPTPELSNYT